MNKYLYWSFLLTSISSLSGFTASATREKVARVKFSDPVIKTKAKPSTLDNLSDLDSLSLSKIIHDQELKAIANTSLVSATLDGKLGPEIIPESPTNFASEPQSPSSLRPNRVETIVPAPQTIALVKEFEGFRANAYIDTDGTPVIGYGQSRINGRKVRLGDRISPYVANQSLKNELGIIQQEILSVVQVELTPNQIGAMTSLAYNAGVHGIQQSTLVKKVNRRDYLGAANEFTRWDKGNLRGRIVKMPGLTRRRQRERQMFLAPQKPTITAYNQKN